MFLNAHTLFLILLVYISRYNVSFGKVIKDISHGKILNNNKVA